MLDNYHLLVEAITDYAIYMLDSTGHIVTWNVGAQRSKGYSEGEVLGKHFSLLFTPEDREKGKPEKELEIALAKGRYEEEGWRVRKDGNRFWTNVILTPLYSERNEHIGFAKITRDLTEKRRNEELYLLLVNQVKEYAIFMMDIEGKILTWNDGAERIKGYAAYEIIGKHFSVFYTAEEKAAEKPKRELEIAIRKGKYEEEGWRLKKDGSLFWANIVITPIYTDRHIGFAKVTRDLTERKQAEKVSRANLILETTNKELERFAFTVSHDLKEPLRKISVFADLLLKNKEHPQPESNQRHLKKIASASERMTTMIDDILDLSSLVNKQEFESFSLKEIVSDTIELLEASIEQSQAVIQYGDLPKAVIIPTQMRQLFQNLISNAVKFAKKEVPPQILITYQYLEKEKIDTDDLWPSEQYLQVSIKDNGIGFEQQYADRIFDLFNRLHSRANYEGTGLGLAICKKIIENHGGTISAKSEPQKGAEFTFIIPA